MKRYLIEREIDGVGAMSPDAFCGAARTSNEALSKLAPRVQWRQSYVAQDKIFCVYLAEDEQAVREHAELSGFPAHRITEIPRVMDPMSARG